MIASRHLPAALLAVAGLAASVVAGKLALSYEEGKARLRAATSFEQTVGAVFASLEREVGAQVAPIQALAAFHASSEVVTVEEFRTFTASFVRERSGLVALEWAPKVAPDQPETLAARLAEVGGPADLQVVEPDPQGGLRPANPNIPVDATEESLFVRWQDQGVQPVVPRTTAMRSPDRDVLLALLRWFELTVTR